MTKDEVEQLVHIRFRRSTVPDPRAIGGDVSAIEARFGCRLPEEFAVMRSLIGHYPISGEHLSQDDVLETYEWELKHNPNWTEDFIPFYSVGNGDFLCFRRSEGPASGVYYVAHDDPEIQKMHASFDHYLRDPKWFH